MCHPRHGSPKEFCLFKEAQLHLGISPSERDPSGEEEIYRELDPRDATPDRWRGRGGVCAVVIVVAAVERDLLVIRRVAERLAAAPRVGLNGETQTKA